MALILARFLFGFTLTWIAAAVLILTTLLVIRLIGIAVAACADKRHADLTSAACVAVLVATALRGIYAVGQVLQDALGRLIPGGHAGEWLSQTDALPPAALFGAAAGLAAMAGIHAWIFRPPAAPGRDARAAASARREADRAAKAPAAARGRSRKPEAAAAAKGGPNTAKSAAPRRPRIPQLGWTALFLLLLGAAVLGLAISITPLGPPGDAAPDVLRRFQDVEQRARPVFTAALALLGVGLLFLLSWLTLRRRGAG